MLKTIFSRLFAGAVKPSKASQNPKTLKAESTVQPDILEHYRDEIASSPLIKESGREAVLKDFLNETKLSDGEPLSLEEKRTIGINPRLSITRELYEVLTPEGIACDPKRALKALRLQATFNHNRHISIAKMKSAGIKRYAPLSCRDERDCSWCSSMHGKIFPVEVDFVQLIKENCRCEYCRCALQAKSNS